ncbi:DUF2971 domain-containing protein [Pseudomonas yamanorum]
MKLYYLTSEKWAKVILHEQRLKLSTIAELNDPFELLGASIGESAVRKVLRYVHGRVTDTFGLVCMSTTWQSPVMWAHYGDKHKGVCLGFEVIEQRRREVTYEPTRLSKLLGESPRLGNVTAEVLNTLLTTKSAEWSYEKEHRLIVRFENAIPGPHGMHFLPFNNEFLVVKEVILGSRCDWSLQAAKRAVGIVPHKVSLKRVRPSFQNFKMVQQRKEPIVYVKPKP